jgi:hypothetical protein
MGTEERFLIAEECTVNSMTSADGTQIGSRQIGHGFGVILVQGAMGTAYNCRNSAANARPRPSGSCHMFRRLLMQSIQCAPALCRLSLVRPRLAQACV